jgi:recombination protein RecT
VPAQQNNKVATKRTIQHLLEGEQFKNAVAKCLPKHLPPERFIRVAVTAMTRTPKLAQCEQASFFERLLELSSMGLEPDGRRAHLIPFENRKRGVVECQLIVDYKGIVELAMRSGVVSFLHADVVCDNDEFEYDRGELKKHKIDFRKDRGAIYAVYAVCRFKDGTEKCDVMSKRDVDAIRARSRAANSGPWVTDYNEMAKKTVFRRLSKWLPLSAEFRDALDKDLDEIEETRFQSAKPVFGATVEADKAVFELPPAETGDSNGDNDGDLGPQNEKAPEPPKEVNVGAPTPRAKQQPEPEPKPTVQEPEPEPAQAAEAAPPTPETPASPATEKDLIKLLQNECAKRGMQVSKFCVWACQKYHLSPVDTIEEIVEYAPQRAIKIWKDCANVFAEAEKAIKTK